jgi:hypothetical protein
MNIVNSEDLEVALALGLLAFCLALGGVFGAYTGYLIFKLLIGGF